jgi:chaperonin GroEL (HSP60 family)
MAREPTASSKSCQGAAAKDWLAASEAVLMLDEVLGRPGEDVEIEDIVGEDIVLSNLKVLIGKTIKLNHADRQAESLPSIIKAAAKRQGVELPDGWKASVAIHLVSEWAEKGTRLPDAVLDPAETLFKAVADRFEQGILPQP